MYVSSYHLILLFFLDDKMIRAALCPLSEVQNQAHLWLERYFETYGDVAPNGDEVRLLIMQKLDAYKKYCHEFTSLTLKRPIVDYSTFNSLWKTLFPKCVRRPWCSVPGKCNTCYEIDRLRRIEEDVNIQDKLREAHAMHRGGLFMLERNEYMRRIDNAIRVNSTGRPSIMSIVIDGMDQSHCRVPYLGTQGTFSAPLKQCITGVKQHGHGVTLYRTVDTITKGANFTIYCILDQIEKWKLRNGYYPEELYIQVIFNIIILTPRFKVLLLIIYFVCRSMVEAKMLINICSL